MTEAREIKEASMFYRISKKGKKASSLSAEDAAKQVASLPEDTEVHGSAPKDPNSSSSSMSVARSWRVSEEEFIIKVDMSPVHMSAAQRMFGGKKQPAPPKAEDEEVVAQIDDTPLHYSAAKRKFTSIPEEEPEHEAVVGDFWSKLFKAFK